MNAVILLNHVCNSELIRKFASLLMPPSPVDVSCGWQDILKGVYYALVLALWNPEKISKLPVKTKATVDAPWLYLYVQPSLCQGHWCIRTPMATLGTSGLLVYTYSVGSFLLLFCFSTFRLARASRSRSKQQGRTSRFLFVFIVLIYITLGCRSPRPLANGCYGYRSRHIGGLHLPALSRPIDHLAQRSHHEQGGRATA